MGGHLAKQWKFNSTSDFWLQLHAKADSRHSKDGSSGWAPATYTGVVELYPRFPALALACYGPRLLWAFWKENQWIRVCSFFLSPSLPLLPVKIVQIL